MFVPGGSPGQRISVLPAPTVSRALAGGITSKLLAPVVGYFPHTAGHYKNRPEGAKQVIIILCTSGVGWLEVAGVTRPITAGTAVVIPAKTGHSYWADHTDPWTIWWMHVIGTDVEDLVDQIVGSSDDLIQSVGDMYTAVSLVEQALSHLERDETFASIVGATGAAWNLLAHLASDRLHGHPLTRDRVQIVQAFLRQHLDSQSTVKDLAKLANLSTSHFSVVFKAATGMGVVEYLKRLRNARARELLISSNLSISEISLVVGYNDPFYFSRQFRAINGTSPNQFRTTARKDSV
ncbi:AraC family transcriptional regulator [Diaminobutyricibacter tongyongensis]|uniref:AraC family transcriptional regulator n=1 Tax=Leifsonia tongyongensis TaxID=1268043 RepID=A0A6L9XW93_9MICO|nr:AraC family transcriptional regulator [Diaminobutyricibacter tongyongensis]NEN05653.1 AraC family transcriptional regulator [Diaminobutyricibacter tongyongensis]